MDPVTFAIGALVAVVISFGAWNKDPLQDQVQAFFYRTIASRPAYTQASFTQPPIVFRHQTYLATYPPFSHVPAANLTFEQPLYDTPNANLNFTESEWISQAQSDTAPSMFSTEYLLVLAIFALAVFLCYFTRHLRPFMKQVLKARQPHTGDAASTESPPPNSYPIYDCIIAGESQAPPTRSQADYFEVHALRDHIEDLCGENGVKDAALRAKDVDFKEERSLHFMNETLTREESACARRRITELEILLQSISVSDGCENESQTAAKAFFKQERKAKHLAEAAGRRKMYERMQEEHKQFSVDNKALNLQLSESEEKVARLEAEVIAPFAAIEEGGSIDSISDAEVEELRSTIQAQKKQIAAFTEENERVEKLSVEADDSISEKLQTELSQERECVEKLRQELITEKQQADKKLERKGKELEDKQALAEKKISDLESELNDGRSKAQEQLRNMESQAKDALEKQGDEHARTTADYNQRLSKLDSLEREPDINKKVAETSATRIAELEYEIERLEEKEKSADQRAQEAAEQVNQDGLQQAIDAQRQAEEKRDAIQQRVEEAAKQELTTSTDLFLLRQDAEEVMKNCSGLRFCPDCNGLMYGQFCHKSRCMEAQFGRHIYLTVTLGGAAADFDVGTSYATPNASTVDLNVASDHSGAQMLGTAESNDYNIEMGESWSGDMLAEADEGADRQTNNPILSNGINTVSGLANGLAGMTAAAPPPAQPIFQGFAAAMLNNPTPTSLSNVDFTQVAITRDALTFDFTETNGPVAFRANDTAKDNKAFDTSTVAAQSNTQVPVAAPTPTQSAAPLTSTTNDKGEAPRALASPVQPPTPPVINGPNGGVSGKAKKRIASPNVSPSQRNGSPTNGASPAPTRSDQPGPKGSKQKRPILPARGRLAASQPQADGSGRCCADEDCNAALPNDYRGVFCKQCRRKGGFVSGTDDHDDDDSNGDDASGDSHASGHTPAAGGEAAAPAPSSCVAPSHLGTQQPGRQNTDADSDRSQPTSDKQMLGRRIAVPKGMKKPATAPAPAMDNDDNEGGMDPAMLALSNKMAERMAERTKPSSYPNRPVPASPAPAPQAVNTLSPSLNPTTTRSPNVGPRPGLALPPKPKPACKRCTRWGLDLVNGLCAECTKVVNEFAKKSSGGS